MHELLNNYDVLIGCEESGTVRDAMIAIGLRAISCDLLPTRSPGPHFQGDVREVINAKKWPLIILHPDCTTLAVSGNRWYGKGQPHHEERQVAIRWTVQTWEHVQQCAERAALENPVGVLSTEGGMGVPQYIHPWQYGHGEQKKTGLWLWNLPELVPTNIVEGREQRVWRMGPSPNRKRDRSVTYSGVADAFANQWGKLVLNSSTKLNTSDKP